MTRYFRRRSPTREETAAAVVLAAGVGAVTYYVTRLFLAREPLAESPRTPLSEPPPERLPEAGTRRGALPPEAETE